MKVVAQNNNNNNNNNNEKTAEPSIFQTREQIEKRLEELRAYDPLKEPKVLSEIQNLEGLLQLFNVDVTQTAAPQELPVADQQAQQPMIPEQPVMQPVQQLPPAPVMQQTAQVIQPSAPAMPVLQQLGTQSEKHHHSYVPMVFDDPIGCVTFVVKMTVDASNRLSMADYARLSQECLQTSKRDSTDIARLYLYGADDYDTMIRLDIGYIHANEIRERKIIFVDKEACEENRFYKELTRNGIHCFNGALSHREISEYLYQLILSKMSEEKHDLPTICGFDQLDGTWCFITEEYCRREGLPIATSKTFTVKLNTDITSEQVETEFTRFAQTCHNTKQFLLLNTLRIMGLLSTPLNACGIRFDKVVFLHGEGEKLAPYLQVYNRGIEAIRPESINVPADQLESYFDDQKDCVVLLEDRAAASSFQKKNGTAAVEFLSNLIYDHVNSAYIDYLFLTVVFSDRLSQMMQSEKALVLDFTSFTPGDDYTSYELRGMTYFLDDLIVKRVCSNFTDFQNCMIHNKTRYEQSAKRYDVQAVTFTCLMLVYHEMCRQFGSLNALVPESDMEDFLVQILKVSDKRYNGGSIAAEFQTQLNQMLMGGQLELVQNSSMNGCYGTTGTKPVVFHDAQWLYIPAETFAAICEKLTLANTVGSVRKALHTAGWLKTSEDNMTYKATLYDSRYHGKLHVTAVTLAILTDEAKAMRRGGMFNFTPCEDAEGDRILLGTDEHGRRVYWSIGHPDLGNTHLMVNGRPGMGKSTTVNLLVKELFNRNQNVVYVDYSHSDTPEKLRKSGLDEAFQKEHIVRYAIEECLEETALLEQALSAMASEHKIIIFEAPRYGKPVEDFLTALYDAIASDSTISIFLVIDEVHSLDYKKGSAVYNIVENGRGNGLSLIGIFQGPHEAKPKQYSMMNQAEVKLIFKVSSQDDGKAIADANSLKPPSAFTEHMMSLKKRHCLVIGNLESDNGELLDGRFVEITVPQA